MRVVAGRHDRNSGLDRHQARSPFKITRKRLTGDRRTGLLGVLEHTRQDLCKRRTDLGQLHTPSYHEHWLGGQFPVDTSIDRALEAVCLKAMALKPGDRYASPKALAEDVERWMADEPVTASDLGPPTNRSQRNEDGEDWGGGEDGTIHFLTMDE